MSAIIILLGLLVGVLGGAGVLSPAWIVSFANSFWRSRPRLYLAVAIRLLFGVLLVIAAPASRFPLAVRAIGLLSVASAALLPFLGFERVRSFVEWWVSRPSGFIRAWSVMALALGAFLVYAGS